MLSNEVLAALLPRVALGDRAAFEQVGSVAQLWALPKDGSAAFPVGVVPGKGTATVALADTSEKLFFDVSRLAVSIEAAPAKAGDKPSGDFVLSGHCVKLW